MIRIWDRQNRQWLEPMSITFDGEGKIARVTAVKLGEDPLSQGWYALEGKDLDSISISGTILHNEHLYPGEK